VNIELFTYQIVMFSHAWALKAWRFRKLMSLQDYVERGLLLMLNPVLTPRGKRKFALINQPVRNAYCESGAEESPEAAC